MKLRYSLRQIYINIVSIPFLFCFFIFILPFAKTRDYLRKRKRRKFRILWGPIPIITISTNSKAERLYGYESQTLVYKTYYLTDHFDYNLEHWFRNPVFKPFLSWIVFLWALLKYDVFHFFFDQGLLPGKTPRGINRIELPLLKMAGKKVIVSAYGGDVRYENKCRNQGKYNCCTDCDRKLVACICSETLARSNINYVNRYADMTLSMGDMMEYTPGSRKDIYYWAIDLKKIEYVGVRPDNIFPIKVVHAPNHRQFKGTKYLMDTVNRLKKRGIRVELRLIEGVPNKEAIQFYKEADIIAEQFLIGWHGYLAIEGMALGKPVISYIRKPMDYLPSGIDCPILSADPDTLEETLLWLIQNPEKRAELGRRGRAYVERVFSLESVGKRFDRIYQSMGIKN